MKYIKTYEIYTVEFPGQLVSKDEIKNMEYPNSVEITCHIGTPVKKLRIQKILKSPKTKLKSISSYQDVEKRIYKNRKIEL